MTTGSLLTADLVVAVLAAAGWLGGGAASGARRRPLAMGLAAFALLATLARATTITALACAGWWFAAEKILIAAPLSLAAVVVAGSRLLRPPGDIRSVAVPLLFAGYAETSALLVTVLHGYPASAGAGLLAVAGVVAATRFRGASSASAPSRRCPGRPSWWSLRRWWPASGWPPLRALLPAHRMIMNIGMREPSANRPGGSP
jgi:hypothetical protein